MKTFSGFAYNKSKMDYKIIMYCSEQRNNNYLRVIWILNGS